MPGVVLTYLCSRIPGVRWADAFMLVGSERGELCVEATAARHVGLFGVLDVRLCYAMCFGLHFICVCDPLLHRSTSRKARGPFTGHSLGSFFGLGMLTAAPESSANDPAIIDGCSLEQSVVLSFFVIWSQFEAAPAAYMVKLLAMLGAQHESQDTREATKWFSRCVTQVIFRLHSFLHNGCISGAHPPNSCCLLGSRPSKHVAHRFYRVSCWVWQSVGISTRLASALQPAAWDQSVLRLYRACSQC